MHKDIINLSQNRQIFFQFIGMYWKRNYEIIFSPNKNSIPLFIQ